MAARVNVKFVVILSVVLVAVFAAAATTAYFVATKSAAEYVALGDQQAAEGNWKEAARMYERAVGHDEARSNLEYLNKWRDAVEKTSYDRQIVFSQVFYTKYRPLLRQIAMVDRGNVDAHHAYLDMVRRETVNAGFSPEAHQVLVDQTEEFLRLWEGASEDSGWPTLRRYRGIARSRMSANGAEVTDAQVRETEEDLLAALRLDPSDDEAVVSFAQLKVALAQAADLTGRRDEADEHLSEASEQLAAFVEANPTKVNAFLGQTRVDLFTEVRERLSTGGELDETASRALAASLLPQVEQADEIIRSNGAENLDARVALLFRAVEDQLDPEARSRRSTALIEWALEAQPENAELLLVQADSLERVGQSAAAIEALERVVSLESPTMGLRGLQQFSWQQQAVQQQTRLAITRWGSAPDDEKPALLVEAKAYRDKLATIVAEDSPALQLADARIMVAEDRLDEAERELNDYNAKTDRSDPDALGIQGRIAVRRNKLGVARDIFERIMELPGTNISAMLQLAEVYERLNDLPRAEAMYLRAQEFVPSNELVQRNLRRIQLLSGEATSDDPIEAALFDAERLARGSAVEPADPKAAVERLRRAASETGYDPRIVVTLGQYLLDFDQRDDALVEVRRGLERHPDSEALQRLERVFSAEDPTAILVTLIDESARTPLGKALTKHDIFATRGRFEEAAAALAEAEAIAPDDERVIELGFVRAANAGDTERATFYADRATETNADTVGGLTYKARLEMLEGDTAGAIATLRRALDTDELNWVAWRLLGRTSAMAGLQNDAVAAFEEAISIRPNDSGLITEYVRALVDMGRVDEALEVAREREGSAREDNAFIDLWLTLEGAFGDRQLALERRTKLLELYPEDRVNRAALARVHMDLSQFDPSIELIRGLREEADTIGLVGMEAEWHAARNDLVSSQAVFSEYIVEQDPETLTAQPYIEMGRFLLNKGITDRGLAALRQARGRQNETRREADKALGDAYMTLGRNDEAADSMLEVVEAGADDANGTYRKRLIEVLIRAERIEEAEAQLELLGPEFANDVVALMLRSDVARRNGETDRAIELLNGAVSAEPGNPTIYLQRARVLSDDERKTSDAIADLEEAVRLRPGYVQAHRFLATLLARVDRRDEALEQIGLAVEANPDLDELLYQYVNELLRENRPGQAIEVANDAVERRPRDLQRKLTFASLFSRYAQWDRAASLLGQAWQQAKNPEIGARYVDALLTVRPPDVRTAQTVLAEIAEVVDFSRNARLLAQRAMVFSRQKLMEQARADATTAFDLAWEEVDQNPIGLFLWLGWGEQIFQERRELSDYLASLERSFSADDSRKASWVRLLRGRTMLSSEDAEEWDRGRALLESLVNEVDEAGLLLLSHRVLGNVLFERNEYQAAADQWRRVLEINNRDWESANNLAFTLSKHLDAVEEASPYAEMAVELQPENPPVLDTLGWIRYLQGRHADADELFAKALSLNPDPNTGLRLLVHASWAKLGLDEVSEAKTLHAQAEQLAQTAESLPDEVTRELTELRSEISSR